MRKLIFAAVLALPAPAIAADIDIAMDQVRTVTFAAPVATVYVGNPAIADINMIDARHAFVIGKSFGSTNLVALDGAGKQVFDNRIMVRTNINTTASTLVVNRGAQRTTYNCAANRCEPSPQPGDGNTTFMPDMTQLAAHAGAARSAAAAQ